MASRSVFVLATVLSVQGKFAYPCCTRCRKRVRTLEQDQKFSCSSCKQFYEGDDVHYRYRISLVVSDRSQVANVTVFGSCLDVFFGASATEFMRFLSSKQSKLDNQTVELNKLVHPAMQQCFVGSMLKFGFRLSPPCRMESQILHCSPVNLRNVVSKQQMQKAKSSYQAKLEGNQHGIPSVLANLVAPSLSTEYQTVLGILQGYLERLHTTASSTPPSPDGKDMYTEDCYEGPKRTLSCGDGSAIHCSTGLGVLTSPLVLTCDSDISNSAHFSTPSAKGMCSELAAEDGDLRNTAMMQSSEKGCFEDFSPWNMASQELKDLGRSSCVSQPRGATTPSSASLTRNEPCGYREYTDTSQLCPEIKWSQLEDLPSSEDLSAFLAELALDGDSTGDEEGQVVVASVEQNTAASDRHNEWGSFNEPNTASVEAVDKLQEFTELTDLPSSEDLEAFLADMDEGCFVQDSNHTSSYSPSIPAAALTSDSPKSLKISAPEKTSFIGNKLGKGHLHSEVSTTVVHRYDAGYEANMLTVCRHSLGSDLIRTDGYMNEGYDGKGPCANARRVSAENDHQGSAHKNCSTPSLSSDTPLRVAMDTNKACRATKRTQGDKRTPNNLRVALLRKRFTRSVGCSVSSPDDLSPQKKIRRKGEQCHDTVYDTPEHGDAGFGAYSEELFTGVEECSASHVCDSCSQNNSIVRSTDFSDVFTCEESAGVQEPSILDSSSSTPGKCGVMRKCSAQEADKSVAEEQDSYVCSETFGKDIFERDSSSYAGSPELFSHSSSSFIEGSPSLFSSTVNSDEYSSSREASGSILLFSDQDSSYLSSVCCPESVSNIQFSHSTPLPNSRCKAKVASANQHLIQCRQRFSRRSTKGATPQSRIIPGTGLMETPLMFSQLSNGSLVSSPSIEQNKMIDFW